jgi:prepilin-type N-terminal cleavage/methylation domain-containing protein
VSACLEISIPVSCSREPARGTGNPNLISRAASSLAATRALRERIQSRAGFTLIEVSIAVFILAMIVAVSVPAFVRSFNDMSLRETARTFSTMCQLGRVEAVQSQTNVVLYIDLEQQRFWLTGGSEERVLKSHEIPRRVTLAAAELVGEPTRGERGIAVNFYPNGTCDSATVLFRGADKQALTATIDPITCKALAYPVKP